MTWIVHVQNEAVKQIRAIPPDRRNPFLAILLRNEATYKISRPLRRLDLPGARTYDHIATFSVRVHRSSKYVRHHQGANRHRLRARPGGQEPARDPALLP